LSARIRIRVTPKAGRTAIDGWDGDVLRVRVSAAPAGGAANEAVVRLLAKKAGVAPSRVTIVAGATARIKTISIDGVDPADLRALLT
jgi:uncharacterized protein (TIGR00251 family)